jgi:prepilin-type processing-associated H-X9-DG protein
MAFVQDNRGYLPECTRVLPGKPANKSSPDNYQQWYELIGDYAEMPGTKAEFANSKSKASILKCPVYSLEKNPYAINSDGANEYPFGYAMNIRPLRYSKAIEKGDFTSWYSHSDFAYVIAGVPQQKFRLASITNVATRLLLMDSNTTTIEVEPGPDNGYEEAPGTTAHFNPVNGIGWDEVDKARYPADRHAGKVNNLYFDGHAGHWNTKVAGDKIDAMRSVNYPDYATGK